jgi:stress response protein YsnF
MNNNILEQVRMSTIEHPSAKVLKWRREHPEMVKAYNVRYYAENRERISLQKKQRYQLKKQQYAEAMRLQAEQLKVDADKIKVADIKQIPEKEITTIQPETDVELSNELLIEKIELIVNDPNTNTLENSTLQITL